MSLTLPPDCSHYIPTKEAAKQAGYSADYLARLARSGEVRGRHVGRAWFIDPVSLDTYLRGQEIERQERIQALARSRALEYRRHQVHPDSQISTHSRHAAAHKAAHEQPRPRAAARRPSIAPASVLSHLRAAAIALAVVGAGGLVAHTTLIPQSAERALSLAQEASTGFSELTGPAIGAIAHRLADLRTVIGRSNARATYAVRSASAPASPQTLLASIVATKPAVLTSNRAIISAQAQLNPTNKRVADTPSLALGSIAAPWTALVQGTHALIAADVRLAYAVPVLAPEIARASTVATLQVGLAATDALTVLALGSRDASRSIALALVRAPEGLGSIAYAIYRLPDALGSRYLSVIKGTGSLAFAGASLAIDQMPHTNRLRSQLASVAGDADAVAAYTGNMLQTLVTSAGLAIMHGVHQATLAFSKLLPNSADSANKVASVEPTTLAAAAAATTPEATTTASTSGGAPPIASPGGIPIVVSAPISTPQLSYGDIIDYDSATGAYTVSHSADDQSVFGVAMQNPPVLLATDVPGGIPVMEDGRALVNVTLENGPIRAGDEITPSSVPGKGMKATPGASNVLGIAREAFTGSGDMATTSVQADGSSLAIGTIVVDVRASAGGAGGAGPGGCTVSPVICALAAKVNATPLVSLLRYLVAAAVALGALYLAFRTFMADATNGIISVGRNPRAKSAIQAMIIFNGVLGVVIAIAGLAAGLTILLIRI